MNEGELAGLIFLEAEKYGFSIGHIPRKRYMALKVEGNKAIGEYVEEATEEDYKNLKELMPNLTYEKYLSLLKDVAMAAARRLFEFYNVKNTKYEGNKIYAEMKDGSIEFEVEDGKATLKIEGNLKTVLHAMLVEVFIWLEPDQLGEVKTLLEDVQMKKWFMNFFMFLVNTSKKISEIEEMGGVCVHEAHSLQEREDDHVPRI